MNATLTELVDDKIKSNLKPSDTQKTVDLVFASDEFYIKYTVVTLASILKNYNGSKPLRVFVLLDKLLDEETTKKVQKLKSINEFEFHQIVVDATYFRNIKTSEGISIATYYRLLMHHLLPEDCKKVIYLDSDLIIQKSIDALFEVPLDGYLLGGVEDSISRVYNKRFGIPEDGRHINAGVMLINVELMRLIDFTSIVEGFLSANRYRMMLGDQQIIAEIFHAWIKYVPIEWNVHGSMFKAGWIDKVCGVDNQMPKQEAIDAIKAPAIIHYTLKRKPWISLEHPKSKIWFNYLASTPFAKEIKKPEPENKAQTSEKNTFAAEIAAHQQTKPKKATIAHFLRVIVPATALSFLRIRKTRLAVLEAEKRLKKLESRIDIAPAITPSLEHRSIELDTKLKLILTARHQDLNDDFSAREIVEKMPENSCVLANVKRDDMEGGYAENIKSIVKTSNFSFNSDVIPNYIFLLSQRIEQQAFWHCVQTSYLHNVPLYFTEVALFGAYASYFDPNASLNERRALGFMIDDMGYYFDARQPSRIERTLNDPSFQLTLAQKERVDALILRIRRDKITKYNKYVSSTEPSYKIEEGAVLVIDQKKGDASITFAGASDASFAQMLEDAVNENPDRPIYFKRHPDSIQRNMNSYRNRNIQDIKVLPDHVTIDSITDRCDKIYTVSSQVGFEGLLRDKEVVTYGVPFYSNWGLTSDRLPCNRRKQKRTIQEIFYVACIKQSVYINPETGRLVDLEDTIDYIQKLRGW